MRTFTKIGGVGVLLILLLPHQTAFSQNVADQATQTDQPDTLRAGLQGSINPLTDNIFAETGEELLDQSFPNSWPLFGSGIRMSIGGYVKADLIQDFDYIGDRFEFELGSIAVDGSPERELGGITTFHAKESRINFDFRTKSTWKNGKEFPMQVFIEVDWFFDSESFRLSTRLRQAYGVIGRLLVGRTWTTSGDLSALPGLIDFSGGDALYGGRATQIRWQDKINDNFRYAVALEDPGGQVDNPQNLEGAFRPRWPNIARDDQMEKQQRQQYSIGSGCLSHQLEWTVYRAQCDQSRYCRYGDEPGRCRPEKL